MKSVLPPYPDGWYAVAVSKTIAPGDLISKKFMGEEIIIFRTESGKISVMDAYCPHMGAHFAHGGCVEGETIKCPFHGFCFDTKGDCTKTGYGSPPPKKAKVPVYYVEEKNGFVLVYYSAMGEAPTWFIPSISYEGWMPIDWIEYELKSHPQETTENSVDVGHFGETHKYEKVETIVEAKTAGPVLTATYAMERSSFLGDLFKPIRAQFTAHAHGLGYSFVEAKVPQLGIESRFYVQSTPVDGEKIILRIGSCLKKITNPGKINFMLKLFPKFLLNKIIARSIFKNYIHDVSQDFKIWENKKYIIRTPLAPGDGPIGLYRVWAKQFYPKKVAKNQEIAHQN